MYQLPGPVLVKQSPMCEIPDVIAPQPHAILKKPMHKTTYDIIMRFNTIIRSDIKKHFCDDMIILKGQ